MSYERRLDPPERWDSIASRALPIRRLTPSESEQHSRNSVSPFPLFRHQKRQQREQWKGRTDPASIPPRRNDPDAEGADRSICLECRGKGCTYCGHSGHVCPGCRGMRWVRTREWSEDHTWCGSEPEHDAIKRCEGCMNGEEIDADKEAANIVRYQQRRVLQLQVQR